MGRATGAQVRASIKKEVTYGVSAGGNFTQFPLISSSIGLEQDLQADPIIGRGRDPFTPQRDVKNVSGDMVVPIDRHYSGIWLAGLLGAPTTTQNAATGTITFPGNPANNDTITLNGVVWTFKTSGATGTQTNIGANLAATLSTLVTNLNASADTSIDDATYTGATATLTITHDTLGAAGNAYTLAASAAAVSGPTLTGGGYRHRYVSGADALPAYSVEIGHPAVPAFFMNLGILVNTMAVSFATSGAAQATFGLIGQNETAAAVTGAGTPATLNAGNVDSFSQFQGSIKRNGVAFANIESADLNYSNNLDPVRVIRSDGLIAGADPGLAELSGTLTARFESLQMRTDAETDTELEFEFAYILNAHTKLVMTAHNARLPIPKQSVEGPGGIRASYNWRAAFDAAAGRMMTVDLHNDYAGTVYQ